MSVPCSRVLMLVLALGLAPGLPRVTAAREGWTLDSCVTRALSGNPELRAAERDLEAARTRVRQAHALEPPVLSFEAGKLGTTVSDEEREHSWRLIQAFPFPGQPSRAAAVAVLDTELVALDLEATRLRLRGDVIRSYRRLQGDLILLRALEGLQETTQSIEDVTNVRMAAGAARHLDVLRARVEVARLENDLVEARRSQAEHRSALNLLMARAPDAPLEPADSLSFAALEDSLPAVLEEARRMRPALRSARVQIRREEAALALARSHVLPAPVVAFGIDRVPGSSTPGFGGAVALTMPFAPWTDRGARVDEALASTERARALNEVAERRLEMAVRTAYANARAAETQASRFERTLLRDAEDAVRSATSGYEFGQVDGTDLFESLRTLRTVHLERIRALLNYELALVDLQTAEQRP